MSKMRRAAICDALRTSRAETMCFKRRARPEKHQITGAPGFPKFVSGVLRSAANFGNGALEY
jgi:hypothetical protein